MDADLHPTRKLKNWMSFRMLVVLLCLVGAFGVVGWRLYQVQVVQHQQWASRGQGMLKSKVILTANRGSIRDANGELLAHDRTVHELWADTHKLRDIRDVRIRVARLRKMDINDLVRQFSEEEILAEYRRYVATILAQGMADPLRTFEEVVEELDARLADKKKSDIPLLRELQDEDREHWKNLINSNNIVALSLRSAVERVYPCKERLTHVLGYANLELVKEPVGNGKTKDKLIQMGREGVESVMNAELTGTDGYRQIEKDRKGWELPSFRGETVPPVNGKDVTLTIDMHLQDILEGVIEEASAFHRPKRIVAVISNPHTGEILAMGSRPHYERDTMQGTMSNLAIGAQYEPGSVFKIVAFTGALDHRLTHLNETLNLDPDQKVLAAAKLKDHVHGNVTTSQAFAQSSNRASYLLARRMGDEKYHELVLDFGFGKKTGIALTGEVSGRVHPLKAWDNLTFSRMAIGHAVTATPLQMVMAVGAIANGGVLMKPQIIKDLRDEEGNVVRKFEPEAVRRVCTPKTADLVRKVMIEVVSNQKGTGARAAIENVLVAGKTGTSQRRKDNGIGYEEGHYCVSFAGFAPADNPQLCAIVVVDDPKGDPSDLMGGKLAAPIFAELMKQSLHTLSVANKFSTSQISSPQKGVTK